MSKNQLTSHPWVLFHSFALSRSKLANVEAFAENASDRKYCDALSAHYIIEVIFVDVIAVDKKGPSSIP